MTEYQVCRYGRQWAIFAATSRCYVLFGSKRAMERRAAELNKENNSNGR